MSVAGFPTSMTELWRVIRGRLKLEEFVDIGATNAPTFAAGWANFGGGNPVAGYFRSAAGVVYLYGLVVSANVAPSTIFTMPPGFRPARDSFSAANGNDAMARILVRTNGNVQLIAGSASIFLILNTIIFRAEDA